MNKQTITFTASEQTLTKTGGIEHYASNIVSYIEASFTLGDNWAGYDSIRAVWESGYARIATVLDANNKCIVPAEVLTYKSKVNVNLVGSIVENAVLTDRLTTYPILALTVDADARVDSSETTPVTASQFEQFVDVVRDEASAIQNYTYDSEAWAVGQRAGVDVPSTDETYHNNAKYYADQGATLQQEVTDLKSEINKFYFPKSENIIYRYNSPEWTVKAGYLSTSTGWTASDTYDSYYYTAEYDESIYVDIGGNSYFQLCIYPSGNFNDPDYVRYRNTENNLPAENNPLLITKGTMVVVGTIPNVPEMFLSASYIKQETKANNKYHLTYDGTVLNVSGCGVECYFSDATFTLQSGGLFELQNLIYNDTLIFGTNNDYIGPITIQGGDIIGAKHGGETTQSVKIIADGKELLSGADTYAEAFTVYVTSIITDTFSRISVYAFSCGKLTTSSYLTTLKDQIVATVFGAGIISSEDANTIAWLNYKPLTQADTSNNLTEETLIVTNGGTLISRRTKNVSAYGAHPVYFLIYTGRKKLYYYNTFGNGDEVPSGTTFASTAELEFN